MADDRVLVASALVAAAGLLGAGAWFFLLAGHDKPPTVPPPPPATVVSTPPPPPPPPVVAPRVPVAAPRPYWVGTTIDVKHFDAEAFLASALADARKVWKDATLVWLSAVDADAEGVSDLTIGFGRGVSYGFRSAASPPDAGPCMHWVYVGEKGVWSETTNQLSKLCALPRALIGKPRCTVKQAFATMAAKFPPTGRAKGLRWSFDENNKRETHAYWSVDGFATMDGDTAVDQSWGFLDSCAKP